MAEWKTKPKPARDTGEDVRGPLSAMSLLMMVPASPETRRANELLQPTREEARRTLSSAPTRGRMSPAMRRALGRCERLVDEAAIAFTSEFGEDAVDLREWVAARVDWLLRERARYRGGR